VGDKRGDLSKKVRLLETCHKLATKSISSCKPASKIVELSNRILFI
jgi:hypothetical protein